MVLSTSYWVPVVPSKYLVGFMATGLRRIVSRKPVSKAFATGWQCTQYVIVD